MNRFIKQLFCRHDWYKVGFTETVENNLRYSIRSYVCAKCGKIRREDGRFDRIETGWIKQIEKNRC